MGAEQARATSTANSGSPSTRARSSFEGGALEVAAFGASFPRQAALDIEDDRAIGSRRPLSVSMLDLEDPSALNDANGHVCGDHALQLRRPLS